MNEGEKRYMITVFQKSLINFIMFSIKIFLKLFCIKCCEQAPKFITHINLKKTDLIFIYMFNHTQIKIICQDVYFVAWRGLTRIKVSVIITMSELNKQVSLIPLRVFQIPLVYSKGLTRIKVSVIITMSELNKQVSLILLRIYQRYLEYQTV